VLVPQGLYLLLAVALAISLVTDLRSRRILDVVTWPTIVVALVLRLWAQGVGDWERGLGAGLLGAAAFAVVFGVAAVTNRGVGWGDVKLVTAVGAALGTPLVPEAMMSITVAGALQAIAMVLWQARAPSPQTNSGASSRHIPYGVAIALGTGWAMWSNTGI